MENKYEVNVHQCTPLNDNALLGVVFEIYEPKNDLDILKTKENFDFEMHTTVFYGMKFFDLEKNETFLDLFYTGEIHFLESHIEIYLSEHIDEYINRPNIADCKKVIKEMMNRAWYGDDETITWFIEKEEFTDGSFSEKDLEDFNKDVEKLDSIYGRNAIASTIEGGWSMKDVLEADDYAIAFYGQFLELYNLEGLLNIGREKEEMSMEEDQEDMEL